MTFDVESLKVTDGHRSLATYIKRESGKQVRPEVIALVDALREAYRKDPERVAERERERAAARERKQAALDKKLEQVRRLAASLGVEIALVETRDPDSEPVMVSPHEALAEEIADDLDAFEASAPEEVPAPPKAPSRKPRKPKANEPETTPTLAVVPPLEATPADDVPLSSDVDVVESQDGWQEMEAEDGFDSQEEAEDW